MTSAADHRIAEAERSRLLAEWNAQAEAYDAALKEESVVSGALAYWLAFAVDHGEIVIPEGSIVAFALARYRTAAAESEAASAAHVAAADAFRASVAATSAVEPVLDGARDS